MSNHSSFFNPCTVQKILILHCRETFQPFQPTVFTTRQKADIDFYEFWRWPLFSRWLPWSIITQLLFAELVSFKTVSVIRILNKFYKVCARPCLQVFLFQLLSENLGPFFFFCLVMQFLQNDVTSAQVMNPVVTSQQSQGENRDMM